MYDNMHIATLSSVVPIAHTAAPCEQNVIATISIKIFMISFLFWCLSFTENSHRIYASNARDFLRRTLWRWLHTFQRRKFNFSPESQHGTIISVECACARNLTTLQRRWETSRIIYVCINQLDACSQSNINKYCCRLDDDDLRVSNQEAALVLNIKCGLPRTQWWSACLASVTSSVSVFEPFDSRWPKCVQFTGWSFSLSFDVDDLIFMAAACLFWREW